jgi:hypothetical protein
MSHAQMIAKAWLDDSYRASLLALGIEVPPRPSDLADEELDTLGHASDTNPAICVTGCGSPCLGLGGG